MMRDLEDGKVKWLWVQVTNPFQSTANANHWIQAAREMDNFIVVSDVYPTLSCKVADLILPVGHDLREVGRLRELGAAHAALARSRCRRPGEARSDVWQMMEFSKRFTLAEVWGAPAGARASRPTGFEDGVLPDVLAEAERMGYRRDQTLYEVLFATPENRKFKWPDPVAQGHDNHTVIHAGIDWFPEKALFEEYAALRPRPRPRPRRRSTSTSATTCAACAGRWWTARRRSGASTSSTTPTRARAAASTSTATP